MSTTTGKPKASSTDKKVKRQDGKKKGPQVCGSLIETSDSVLKRNDLLAGRAVVGDN